MSTSRRLGALADLLPEPLLLVGSGRMVEAANQAAAHFLGRPSDQLLGAPLHSLVADDAQVLEEFLKRCSRTGVLTPGSLTFKCPDGRLVACRCEGAAFRATPPVPPDGIVLRLRDKESASGQFILLKQRIDELSTENRKRRAVEAALREAKEQYLVTLQSIGDAVIATDAQGHITFMNAMAETLTGWDASEALGKHLDKVFVIVNEQSRATVESPVEKVLRQGTTVALANHTVLIRKDHSELSIDDSGAPIRKDDGTILGVVLVFRDLSDRYRLERELVLKTERLEEADRRKNEFLSMLAHELRNPLAPLRNGIEIIKRQQVPPMVARTTQIMARQISHMVRLVDDLLDVSRLTKGKIELRLSRVSIPELIRNAEEMARPLCEERGVGLSVIEPLPGVEIQADLTRLVQVLGNLIGNAAKFSAPGKVTTLSAAVSGTMVEISVADQGVGIHPHNLANVFDLFFQAEQGLGREQGGLGVGLTISKSIAQMHGGAIRAQSEGLGRGSTFTVSLPLSPGKGSIAAADAR